MKESNLDWDDERSARSMIHQQLRDFVQLDAPVERVICVWCYIK